MGPAPSGRLAAGAAGNRAAVPATIPRDDRAWPRGAVTVSVLIALIAVAVGVGLTLAAADRGPAMAALVGGVFVVVLAAEFAAYLAGIRPWLRGDPLPRALAYGQVLGVVAGFLAVFVDGLVGGAALAGLVAGMVSGNAVAVRLARRNRGRVEQAEAEAVPPPVRGLVDPTGVGESIGPVLRETAAAAGRRVWAWLAAGGLTAAGCALLEVPAPVVVPVLVVAGAALLWVLRRLWAVRLALADFARAATPAVRAYVVLLHDPAPRVIRPLLGIWSGPPVVSGGRLPRPERVYRCDDEHDRLECSQGAVVVHEAWVDTGPRPRSKPRWVSADAGIVLPHRRAVFGRWYLGSLLGAARPGPAGAAHPAGAAAGGGRRRRGRARLGRPRSPRSWSGWRGWPRWDCCSPGSADRAGRSGRLQNPLPLHRTPIRTNGAPANHNPKALSPPRPADSGMVEGVGLSAERRFCRGEFPDGRCDEVGVAVYGRCRAVFAPSAATRGRGSRTQLAFDRARRRRSTNPDWSRSPSEAEDWISWGGRPRSPLVRIGKRLVEAGSRRAMRCGRRRCWWARCSCWWAWWPSAATSAVPEPAESDRRPRRGSRRRTSPCDPAERYPDARRPAGRVSGAGLRVPAHRGSATSCDRSSRDGPVRRLPRLAAWRGGEGVHHQDVVLAGTLQLQRQTARLPAPLLDRPGPYRILARLSWAVGPFDRLPDVAGLGLRCSTRTAQAASRICSSTAPCRRPETGC